MTGERKAIKKLAGETAIYGFSTIIARFINFLFVPLYTRYLSTTNYGVLTEFMAYIAMFQVFLTLGLETGCFRYANKKGHNADSVFSNAIVSVSIISTLFLFVMLFFGKDISSSMGYADYYKCYIYIGFILLFDCTTAILFARLRFQYKAWKFSIYKTLKIITEISCNLLLFLWWPQYAVSNPQFFLANFVSLTPDFSYPIFSIFISTILEVILFIPDIIHLKFKLSKKLERELLIYSLPLMIAGLPGVMNDFLDRVLFRFFNVDQSIWRADLGIYQAAVKISVIMSLFVQMFRFAAEPFFFSKEKDKDSKHLYANVMEYFVAFCMLAFLGIVFYLDIIQFVVGKDFRAGMGVVPIMLFSYVLMGILFNVSMWYKLSDKSYFAIYITLAGLLVTAVINVVFLPIYSYWAAAWGHVASFLIMLVLSAYFGNKYYKIPYSWGKIISIIAIALGIYAINLLIPVIFPHITLLPKLLIRTMLILVYIALYYYLYIRKKFNIKTLLQKS